MPKKIITNQTNHFISEIQYYIRSISIFQNKQQELLIPQQKKEV